MSKQNVFHVIKDPVHGTMQFTSAENNWVKPFIDSLSFQRLRHIKQLGLGDFIFPGAVHTRFNHSLGCCYVASQIAHKIGLAEEERQLVMIACLLHDIGHGPFSHAFEDIFHKKSIRHEAWTPFFLAEYRTPEFFARYNRINPRHNLTEEKFSIIERMIMHQPSVNRVLADIVSSQLDADRLDYLLRDSHFCGVTYGQFDFRWMLHCLAIVDSPDGERLGITHKGIGVVEHYLMARRLMTRNIYHHPKKLALEFLLVKLLRNLSQSLDDRLYKKIKHSKLGTFLIAANAFNQSAEQALDPKVIKNEFLSTQFEDYRQLNDYDVFSTVQGLSQVKSKQAASQIAERFIHRQMPKIVRLDDIPTSLVLAQVEELKSKNGYQDWQLAVIKTPHQSYNIEADPILIQTEQNHVKSLNHLSLIIKAMSDRYENTSFLCIDSRIYFDSSIQTFIDHLNKEPACSRTVTE